MLTHMHQVGPPMPNNLSRYGLYVSTRSVIHELDLCKTSVYQLAKDGEIEGIRVLSDWRWLTASVERYLKRQQKIAKLTGLVSR